MKIQLVKKRDATDKDPLIVLIKEPTYYCEKVAIGETLEVDEEMAYVIMGDKRYKGLFKPVTKEAVTEKPAAPKKPVAAKKAPPAIVAAKAIKGYPNKSLETEAD